MTLGTTPNLGLTVATAGTKEPFSLVAHNANLAAIDAAIGLPLVKTSTTTISNTTTETQCAGWALPSGLPVGSTWRMGVFGSYDQSGVASSVTFRGKIGGTAFTSRAITTVAAAISNNNWSWTLDLIITATGNIATGTCRCRMEGTFLQNSVYNPFVGTSLTATAVDTTGNPTFEVTAQWAAASASNTVRCDGAYLHRISNA